MADEDTYARLLEAFEIVENAGDMQPPPTPILHTMSATYLGRVDEGGRVIPGSPIESIQWVDEELVSFQRANLERELEGMARMGFSWARGVPTRHNPTKVSEYEYYGLGQI